MRRPGRRGGVLRWVVLGVACLALLVVLVAWVAGAFYGKVQPGEVAAAPESSAGDRPTAQVVQIERPVIVEAIGTLVATRRTQVASRLMSEIKAIHVRAGDDVSTGDVVVELERTEELARVRQAEEAVAAAEARLAEAEKDLERHRSLLAGRAVTPAQFDAVEAKARAARADEQRAREMLAEARAVLGYATIRAPLDGRVVDRLAEPGDLAQPGSALLTVYDPERLRLEAPVAEQLALRLKPGDPVRVYIDALEQECSGRIDEIVPQARAHSRTVLVKAALDVSSGVYEGMVGRLRLRSKQRRLLCVPEAAIQTLGQLRFAEVVDGAGGAERRFIKTGGRALCAEGMIEVLSGLDASETVLLNPPRTGSHDARE